MGRPLATAISFALLSGCFGIAKAQEPAQKPVYVYDPIHGKLPDESVRNWIRLVILGPRWGMPPIFLISPTRFEVAYPEILIQLPKREYDQVSRHMAASRCTRSDAPISQLSQLRLEVTEHTRDGTQTPCRMSRHEACRYLNGVTKIPEIGWKGKKWEVLRIVLSGFGC